MDHRHSSSIARSNDYDTLKSTPCSVFSKKNPPPQKSNPMPRLWLRLNSAPAPGVHCPTRTRLGPQRLNRPERQGGGCSACAKVWPAQNRRKDMASVFTGARVDDALCTKSWNRPCSWPIPVCQSHRPPDASNCKQTRQRQQGHHRGAHRFKALLEDLPCAICCSSPWKNPWSMGQDHPNGDHGGTGVNGAGKTTSIGKLTKHLADEGLSVLLAAADTFALRPKSSSPSGPTATRWRSSANKAETRRP